MNQPKPLLPFERAISATITPKTSQKIRISMLAPQLPNRLANKESTH